MTQELGSSWRQVVGNSPQFLGNLGAQQILLHLVGQSLHPSEVLPKLVEGLLPGPVGLPALYLGLQLQVQFLIGRHLGWAPCEERSQ